MRRGSHSLGGSVLAVSWIAAGCGDYPAIQYHGEEVKIGTYFDSPLCQGDVDRIDGYVQSLEDELDAHESERIEVFIFAGLSAPGKMPAGCPKDAQGCYVEPYNRVITSVLALEHELAHAVSWRIGRSDRALFDEGIADALANQRTVFSVTSPWDNRNANADDLEEATAAHFMRWLLVEHGADAFRPLLKGKSFQDAYGISLHEASDDYLAVAPWSFPRRIPCDAPELDQVAPNRWSTTVVLDCESGDTRSMVSDRMLSERVISVGVDGLYNVSSSGGNVWLLGCQLEELEVQPPEAVNPETWDPREVLNEAWSYPSAVPRMMSAGEVHQVLLREGQYLLTAESPALDPVDVGIEIWPALEG